MIEIKKQLVLLYDLYFLRYEKPGNKWYELTDYLRDCLKRDGLKISYDDKNQDLKFGHNCLYGLKGILKNMGVKL